MRRATKLCAWFLALGLLAACGSAESGVVSDEGSAPAAEPIADPRDIRSAWVGVVYDFEPVSGPEELTELADLAGTGQVTSVGFGRTEVTEVESVDDPNQTENFTKQLSAIEVQLSEVIKGNSRPGDSIWLELRADPIVLQEVLPVGLDVVVYALTAEQTSPDFTFDSSESDIPAGETIWTPAHPEGLVIAYRPNGGTLVAPAGEIEPAAELLESLPEVP